MNTAYENININLVMKPNMNRRNARVFRIGRSQAVVLPRDWCDGNKIEPGQEVEILYDGIVRVKPKAREGEGHEAREDA